MENEVNEIKTQISITDCQIEDLNDNIKLYSEMLKDSIEYSKNSEEYENLILIHQFNQQNIINYKNEIQSLEFEINLNNQSISILKKENEELKMQTSKNKINQEQKNNQIIKETDNNSGFLSKDNNNNFKQNEKNIINENIIN